MLEPIGWTARTRDRLFGPPDEFPGHDPRRATLMLMALEDRNAPGDLAAAFDPLSDPLAPSSTSPAAAGRVDVPKSPNRDWTGWAAVPLSTARDGSVAPPVEGPGPADDPAAAAGNPPAWMGWVALGGMSLDEDAAPETATSIGVPGGSRIAAPSPSLESDASSSAQATGATSPPGGNQLQASAADVPDAGVATSSGSGGGAAPSSDTLSTSGSGSYPQYPLPVPPGEDGGSGSGSGSGDGSGGESGSGSGTYTSPPPPPPPPASHGTYLIGDYVWNDLNLNGAQDEGEPGIAGVSVGLIRAGGDGTPLQTTATGSDGKYGFHIGGDGSDRFVIQVGLGGYSATEQHAPSAGSESDSNINPVGRSTEFGMGVRIDTQSGPYWQNYTIDAGLVADGPFKLREVTFSGATNFEIAADPGDPEHPAPPHWYDGNLNGSIDITGDRSLPVGFVRGGQVSVSAKWVYDGPEIPYGSVQVRADGPGGYDLGWTSASLQGNLLVLPETKLATPLANHVDYLDQFYLSWQVRTIIEDSGAGVSSNPLYATLTTPGIAPPIFRTVVHISTAAAAGETERAAVIAKTWDAFKDLTVIMAPPALQGMGAVGGGAGIASRLLHYYKNWATTVESTPGLLLGRDGQCKAWVNLFLDTLSVQLPNVLTVENTTTLTSANPLGVQAPGGELLLIRNWTIITKSNLNPQHPYRNYVVINPLPGGQQSFFKETGGTWAYTWLADAAGKPRIDLEDAAGLPGQGTANPKAHFGAHLLAIVDGKFYDVAYGKTYDNIGQWAEASLLGYMIRGAVLEGGANRDYIEARGPVFNGQYNLNHVESKYSGFK